MSNFIAIRNGGATDEQGALRFLRRISTNDEGPARATDLQVGPKGTPNNSVDIAIGDIAIAYQSYLFYGWSDAINNITIADNASGSPRLDAIVAYEDLAVVSAASNNNPNALKFKVVAGTPAGSPVAPNGATIQASVGAGNPYYVLAWVNVPTGFTVASTITNSGATVIVDKRQLFTVGSTAKYSMFIPGSQVVANDISINPQVPALQVIRTISAYAKTAPVGADATFRIYNVTQALSVGTITIAAGSNFAITTSITTATLNANDVLRLDVTAQGSSTLAADVTVQAY